MERFAYVVDATELDDLRPGWPAQVSVALCLEAEGEAGLVLFDSSDMAGLASRIAASTGWEAGSFAVAPQIEGYPTLRPLFSQAQEFLHIVARFDGLDRMAQEFLGIAEPEPEAGPEDDVHARSRITLSLPEGGPDLPSGFRTAEDIAGVAFVSAEIRMVKNRVRVVLHSEKLRRRTEAIAVTRVGFRDDLRCFVLQAEAISDWAPGNCMVLDCPEASFPEALIARMKAGEGRAEVTVTSEGLFVTPTLEKEGPRPARKAPRGALRATLFASVAIGLLSGSVVTALQEPAGRNDILDYRAAPGNSGLNVLESFARSLDSARTAEN